MKKTIGVWALLGCFWAGGAEVVTNSALWTSCSFDTRQTVDTRRYVIGEELIGAAWNNTDDWRKDGDSSAPAATVVRTLMAPVSSDTATWTAIGAAETLGGSAGEGVTASLVATQGAYRVQLVVDGTAQATTYYLVTGLVATASYAAAVPLDTQPGIRVIGTSADDLLDFAYNNTASWVTNGDSTVACATIRLVEMDAHGTPSLVTNWTDTTAITNLACADREGLLRWVSDRKAYYRAELIVGTATNETAYFDFSGCTDAGVKKTLSCFTDEQQGFYLIYHRNETPRYTVGGALVDFDAIALEEGADYALAYATNDLTVGVATPVTVVSRGADWGGTVTFAVTFQEVLLDTAASANHPLDTRAMAVRAVTNAANDLLDFAYNNTADWARGGDATADGATIRLVEMDAHGTPSLVTNWTESTCRDDYAQTAAEGTTRWTSDRKAYFRAERVIGGTVYETAYLDFGDCTDAGLKATLSLFTTNQLTGLSLSRDPEKGWVVTGTVTDTNGVELVAGEDYEFQYSDANPEYVTLQSKGAAWGGRVVLKASFAEFVISSASAGSAFDTRAYHPRRPASEDEILPFAYDANWVAGATAIASVSIAPYAYGELDEPRREAVAVTNAVGTGLWSPGYRDLYQARIVSTLPEGGEATNVVDVCFTNVLALAVYPGVDVTFADGTVTNYLTLAAALAGARAGDAESVALKVDRAEGLTLEAGDDVVFDGGAYALAGGFTVPDGAALTVVGGTFAADPASPADYVPRGCTTTANGGTPATWTVASDWQVGAPSASDLKAFLADDGTLKVIGAGDMQYWAASATPSTLPPWEAYDAAITNVAIGSRVTSVGSEAFSNCVNLVGVTLPGSIENVGRAAFAAVNVNGCGTASNGFVEVTYSPAKTGVASPFTAEELRVVSGLLAGGTYDYDPTAEMDPNCLAYANADGTYTVAPAYATIGTGADLRKYRSVEEAIADVADGETITLQNGTTYTTAETLNALYAEKTGVTIAGSAILDVWGVLSNGVYTCPVRLKTIEPFLSEIRGGDFHGPVYAPTNSLAGGTFSVRPADDQIKEGYAIVETDDDPVRYRVVEMPENGVAVPHAVDDDLVYTGANQVGVIGTEGIVYSGPTNATAAGVYAVTATPEAGKTWPDGTTDAKTIVWGVAPALDLPDGVTIAYDPDMGTAPNLGGWRLTLEKDVAGPILIPDSLGADVGGRVAIDLGGHAVTSPKAVLPAETNGVAAIVITHDPDYAAPSLALEITGPGTLAGGDGADGVASHPAGGAGAAAIAVASGAAAAEPTVADDVARTAGSDGATYVPGSGEPEGLLMTAIDSCDEYLALAIPYANTNDSTGATAPTLDSLVRKTELAAGDVAYVYDRANQTVAKYVLDAEKAWRPAPVIEVSLNGWTTTVGSDVCTLEPGYGIWLRRGAASRPNKVYLWGYRPAEALAVTLAGGTGATRGKTLVANPYGDAWDLNDATRVDWTKTAAEGDWIQVNGGASAIYQYVGGKWQPYTFYAKDVKIPAGYGFWYVRAAGAAAATLTF